MFLKLNHQKLEVYTYSRALTLACYRITKALPAEEKFGMISQIRRAALSIHLNIAEGASKKSEAERRRHYEISRGSIVEVDAAFDIASDLNYLNNIDMKDLEEKIVSTFKLLTGLILSCSKH
jgi:four helix bundle protein